MKKTLTRFSTISIMIAFLALGSSQLWANDWPTCLGPACSPSCPTISEPIGCCLQDGLERPVYLTIGCNGWYTCHGG